jgi:acetyltransferase
MTSNETGASPVTTAEEVKVAGVVLWIRPIGPGDSRRLVAFFSGLSPRSIYMRFFAPMKYLSDDLVERFTHVDPLRHIALVALGREVPSHPILGIGRVIAQADPRHGEFSIVVADAFQGRGIGAVLLQRCIDGAASRGIEKIWGLVLAENTQMLALGRKLGFAIQRAGGAEYELTIDVTEVAPEAERMV